VPFVLALTPATGLCCPSPRPSCPATTNQQVARKPGKFHKGTTLVPLTCNIFEQVAVGNGDAAASLSGLVHSLLDSSVGGSSSSNDGSSSSTPVILASYSRSNSSSDGSSDGSSSTLGFLARRSSYGSGSGSSDGGSSSSIGGVLGHSYCGPAFKQVRGCVGLWAHTGC
jgi:hypothetical protein